MVSIRNYVVRAALLPVLLLCAACPGFAAEPPTDDRAVGPVAITRALKESGTTDYDHTRLHALIIGIDQYANYPRLRCAVNDAKAIAGLLRELYGFPRANVRELYDADATREGILKAIADSRRLTEADSLVVYYAGHGTVDPDTGKGYWIPVDGHPDRRGSALSCTTLVEDELRALKARHVLLLADSCFGGAFIRAELPKYHAGAFRFNSRWALTSGGVEPVPDAGAAGHSVFNFKLQQYLKGELPEAKLVFSEADLFATIAPMVTEFSPTRQVPELGKLNDPRHANGHFVFVRIPPAAPAGPKAGEPFAVADLGLTFVPLKPGRMQLTRGGLDVPEEERVRHVNLTAPFWLSKYEVTNGQYQAFIAASGYDGTQEADAGYVQHLRGARGPAAGERLPVVWVSWHNAGAFCAWLTARERQAGRLPAGSVFRLPTEDELSYACWAGQDGVSASKPMAGPTWRLHDVTQGQANPWGLCAANENAWEWCADRARPLPAAADGATPKPPAGEPRRVVIGGAWGQHGDLAQVRDQGAPPTATRDYLGFRVVCAAPWPAAEPAEGPPAGQDFTLPELGMAFVWVKALEGWVAKYEVTNGEYRKLKPDHDSKEHKGHTLNGDRQPVVYVNWDEAVAYAAWLTERERAAGRLLAGWAYRLPTEKEWVALACCGDNRTYPWGSNLPPTYGNYAGEETKAAFDWDVLAGYRDDAIVSCDVEKSGKNDWGLYGVGGNVWEVCADSTDRGKFGAWRGGSWGIGDPLNALVTYRYGLATYSSYAYGFRLVLTR